MPIIVKLGKPWTPEIFLECFCVARKKPIRHEKTELQARTLISLWFCGYSSHVLIFAVIGHNTIKIPEIEFSSFCSFHTVTGKQSLSLSFQDSRRFWIFWGSEVWVRCHRWKHVSCAKGWQYIHSWNRYWMQSWFVMHNYNNLGQSFFFFPLGPHWYQHFMLKRSPVLNYIYYNYYNLSLLL